jgi:CRP-like cAMP-binding protein
LIFLKAIACQARHSVPMLPSTSALLQAHPVQKITMGTALLKRATVPDAAIFIESGRVALGIASATPPLPGAPLGSGLEHQLGMVQGPAWLEANAAVLALPSAMDAVAETEITLRRVPLAAFHAALADGSAAMRAVLDDVARAHRQQTELAVSRLAKDAEARCAEWLLRHAESSDKGVCSVQLQQRKRLIAAQLGIAPETLSRVFRHLRERSLISGSGRTVNLVDPSGLRSLAGV